MNDFFGNKFKCFKRSIKKVKMNSTHNGKGGRNKIDEKKRKQKKKKRKKKTF